MTTSSWESCRRTSAHPRRTACAWDSILTPPLSEVDRVLASYLGIVSDEALPEAYLALLSRLFVEGN